MKLVCKENQCVGCMACVEVCTKGAISIVDSKKAYNANIDEEKCINCGACKCVCPNVNPVKKNNPISWKQGWAIDETVRQMASSGGFATAISKAFTENGGYVVSAVFSDGRFIFSYTDRCDDVAKFSGSKYVKCNPTGIYKEIKKLLLKGQRVLFIALPCQVAALKNYVSINLQDCLYTIDLICHGTPSPKLLEDFLSQYQTELGNIKAIEFRVKDHFQLKTGVKSFSTPGTTDCYLIAFLNGLIYTDNCYVCSYATLQRCSDLTLGDSWGSSLPLKEQKKGISLAVCMTEKGEELLHMAALHLEEVNLANAIAHNHQLERPSEQPDRRDTFFLDLNKGIDFNSLIYRRYPKQCIKQKIKALLIRLKIGRQGNIPYTDED